MAFRCFELVANRLSLDISSLCMEPTIDSSAFRHGLAIYEVDHRIVSRFTSIGDNAGLLTPAPTGTLGRDCPTFLLCDHFRADSVTI